MKIISSSAAMAGDDDNPPPQKIDPLSPYSLASQEGPGQSITHVKLQSDNYDEWSRSMRRSLKSRRKFGFCDGSITKPTDEFLLGQWEVVHCTVVQWILNSIDPSIRDSVSDPEDAQVLWSDLADQYAVVDGAKIHNLKTQLHECRQTKAALARQDSERLHRFLMGLDKSLYGPIQNHQLAIDPLPTLSRVYHAVIQEERLLVGPIILC
ncbi:uncharacterized protein LOC141651294 [Silene latifolia]|uniref:uncharacterized protein LOC141651294 n=1 Tax=Silene latifolia TaxID=37657 RepID=UPI003D781B15